MTTVSMQGWQASQFGKSEDVLHLTEITLPEPGEGENRVRVLLASIGLPDKLAIEGNYPLTPNPPVIPGRSLWA